MEINRWHMVTVNVVAMCAHCLAAVTNVLCVQYVNSWYAIPAVLFTFSTVVHAITAVIWSMMSDDCCGGWGPGRCLVQHLPGPRRSSKSFKE